MAYINYRQLKKAIGRAEQEWLEIDSQHDDNDEDEDEDDSQHRQSGEGDDEHLTRRVRLGPHDTDLERGEAGEGKRVQIHRAAHEATLAPTMSTSPTSNPSGFSSATVPAPSTRSRRATSVRSHRSTASTRFRARLASYSLPGPSSPTKSAHDPSAAKPSNRDDFITRAGDFNPKRWRAGFDAAMDLDDERRKVPEHSARFFDQLDAELDKVTEFYKAREDEAGNRFDELSAQWHELVTHKREFQASRVGGAATAASRTVAVRASC